MTICFKAIGTIHTPFKRKEGMPIQSSGSKGIKGTIELKREYIDGLFDLEKFSHIYLIHYFHKSKGFDLQVIPFLDDKPHGVFATRAPRMHRTAQMTTFSRFSFSRQQMVNLTDICN